MHWTISWICKNDCVVSGVLGELAWGRSRWCESAKKIDSSFGTMPDRLSGSESRLFQLSCRLHLFSTQFVIIKMSGRGRWAVKDESKPKKERRVKIGDIIFIVILLLIPGIRGYSNWMWYEYLFILIVIAAIVYSWITGDRSLMGSNRRFHQETHHDGES